MKLTINLVNDMSRTVNKINWTGLVTVNLSNNILVTSVLSIIHNISFNIKILPVIYQYVKTNYWYL